MFDFFRPQPVFLICNMSQFLPKPKPENSLKLSSGINPPLPFFFFFSVPPDKPKIFDERGQEVRLKLGPYRIGDEVRLKCTAYGGMYYIFRKRFLKFSFSEKTTKISYGLLSKRQNHLEDGANFCGLLRKAELYKDV